MFDDDMEYDELLEIVENVVNEDDEETDVQELVNHIEAMYRSGKLSNDEYEELMSDLDEIMQFIVIE